MGPKATACAERSLAFRDRHDECRLVFVVLAIVLGKADQMREFKSKSDRSPIQVSHPASQDKRRTIERMLVFINAVSLILQACLTTPEHT